MEHRPGRPSVLARVVLGVVVVTCALAGTAVAASSEDGTPTPCRSGRRASGGDICVARRNALATELLGAVREVDRSEPIRGLTFGVWVEGKELLTGAVGEQVPGVPATRDVHFRFGNVGETMMATLLLQLVDDGKLALDDPVAKFFPDLPEANDVTLQMLASSTSGYADFVTSAEFGARFEADPFQHWDPDEVIAIAMRLPTLFPPGTSWAFSDTNFVLLGQILQKASGMPYDELVQKLILDELGLANTSFPTTSAMPSPVLHAYSNERGKYEEATYWGPSWVTNAGNIVTTLADMGKWTPAWGAGTLLTKSSHELQVGDENVGLGPLTAETYYGMGAAYAHGWTVTNPQVDGYTGVIGYLPSKKATVVVASTFSDKGDISVQYAAAVFNKVAEILSPENAPNLTVCPRGC